jgi:hypothetical protein
MIEVIEQLLGAGAAPGAVAVAGLTLVFRRIGVIEKKIDNGLTGSVQEVREAVAALEATCKERGKQGHC